MGDPCDLHWHAEIKIYGVFLRRDVGKVTDVICIVASYKAGGANSSDFQVGWANKSILLSEIQPPIVGL